MTAAIPATVPLVSIVIPVYRGEPFLGQAIASALAQSWPHVEVIVVNDGSDDDGATERIVRGFGDAIRYVAKENGGVATALNAGIAAARGAYVSWLSHDDLYHPHKVARQMQAMLAQPGPAVVFGDFDVIDSAGRFLARVDAGEGFDPGCPIWTVLEGRLNGCAMLFPRACFDTCGLFDPGLPTTQDYALWARFTRHFPFVHVPGAHVMHRTHEGQGSRTPRHVEEVNLLWTALLADMTPQDMIQAAGSELRFLIRVLRWLRRTNALEGAIDHVESRLLDLLGREEIALVWLADDLPPGQGDDAAVIAAAARVAAAGPRLSQIVVLEPDGPMEAALSLRPGVPDRRIRVARLGRRHPGDSILQAAAQVTAPLVVVADREADLSAARIRGAIEAIVMGEAQGCVTGTATVAGARMPPGLNGAVLQVAALHDVVQAGTPPGQMTANLGVRMALAVAAPVPALPPLAVPRARRGTGQVGDQIPGQLATAPVPGRGGLMIVTHGGGGGTIRLANLLGSLAQRQADVIWAWGIDNQSLCLSSLSADAPEITFALPRELDAALALLAARGISRIDVVHTQGIERFLPHLIESLAVPFDMTLADYHTVATSAHLMDDEGRFMGEAALADPESPLRRDPSPLLRLADRRIAISRDTAARMASLVPGLPFIAARLPEAGAPARFSPHPAPLAPGEALRVLLPGHLVPHKGRDIVLEVARRCQAAGAPIVFHALGDAAPDVPDMADQANLHLWGRYGDANLNRIVCLLRPHLAWMPFAVPETHSFTLSDMMLQGLPILAVGHGAVAERLDGRPWTWVIDPARAGPEAQFAWLLRLAQDRMATPPVWLPAAHLPPLHHRFYEDDYLAPLAGRPGR